MERAKTEVEERMDDVSGEATTRSGVSTASAT